MRRESRSDSSGRTAALVVVGAAVCLVGGVALGVGLSREATPTASREKVEIRILPVPVQTAEPISDESAEELSDEVRSPALVTDVSAATPESPAELDGTEPLDAQSATPAATDDAALIGDESIADPRALDDGAVVLDDVEEPSADDGDLANEVSEQPLASAQAGEQCGGVTCAPGKVCCNASCGTCVDPGETCSQYACGMPAVPSFDYCGSSTCDVGEVCCNPSCGTCVPAGQTCDPTPCDRGMQQPVSYMCGMSTCNVGMVCCNPSCGICAPPGEPCSHERCD